MRSVDLVLMGDFNFPYKLRSKSGTFLKHVKDNFLPQVLCEPSGKGQQGRPYGNCDSMWAVFAIVFMN